MLNLSKILAKQDKNPLKPLPTGMTPTGSITGPLDCLLFDIYGTLLISGSGDIGTSMQGTRGHIRLQGLLRKFGIDRSPESLLDDFYTAIHARHDRLKKKRGRLSGSKNRPHLDAGAEYRGCGQGPKFCNSL